jgi:hypothetical protein
MIAISLLFVRVLCDCFRPRQQLQAELVVLRHRLNILQRQTCQETGLPGWACRIRTGESVRELSDWNSVTTSPEVGASSAAEILRVRAGSRSRRPIHRRAVRGHGMDGSDARRRSAAAIPKRGDLPMDFPSAVFGAATCMLALLVSSQFTPTTAQTAQQDQTMTATASAPCQMLAPLPWTRLTPSAWRGASSISRACTATAINGTFRERGGNV